MKSKKVNILSNFITREVIACDDKDPPWFNGKIKLFINDKLELPRPMAKI